MGWLSSIFGSNDEQEPKVAADPAEAAARTELERFRFAAQEYIGRSIGTDFNGDDYVRTYEQLENLDTVLEEGTLDDAIALGEDIAATLSPIASERVRAMAAAVSQRTREATGTTTPEQLIERLAGGEEALRGIRSGQVVQELRAIQPHLAFSNQLAAIAGLRQRLNPAPAEQVAPAPVGAAPPVEAVPVPPAPATDIAPDPVAITEPVEIARPAPAPEEPAAVTPPEIVYTRPNAELPSSQLGMAAAAIPAVRAAQPETPENAVIVDTPVPAEVPPAAEPAVHTEPAASSPEAAPAVPPQLAANRESYLKQMLGNFEQTARSFSSLEHIDRRMSRDVYADATERLGALKTALEANDLQKAMTVAGEVSGLLIANIDRTLEGVGASLLRVVPDDRKAALGITSPADLMEQLRTNPDAFGVLSGGRAGTAFLNAYNMLGKVRNPNAEARNMLASTMAIASVPAEQMGLALPEETSQYRSYATSRGLDLNLIAASDYDHSAARNSLMFIRGVGDWAAGMAALPGLLGDGYNLVARPQAPVAGYREWEETAQQGLDWAWRQAREGGAPEPSLPEHFASRTAGEVAATVATVAASLATSGAGAAASSVDDVARAGAHVATHSADDVARAGAHVVAHSADDVARTATPVITNTVDDAARTVVRAAAPHVDDAARTAAHTAAPHVDDAAREVARVAAPQADDVARSTVRAAAPHADDASRVASQTLRGTGDDIGRGAARPAATTGANTAPTQASAVPQTATPATSAPGHLAPATGHGSILSNPLVNNSVTRYVAPRAAAAGGTWLAFRTMFENPIAAIAGVGALFLASNTVIGRFTSGIPLIGGVLGLAGAGLATFAGWKPAAAAGNEFYDAYSKERADGDDLGKGLLAGFNAAVRSLFSATEQAPQTPNTGSRTRTSVSPAPPSNE